MAVLNSPDVIAARRADWRVGPVVYQVFVDRFAPSSNLEAKKHLFKSPRRLMDWAQVPQGGRLDPTTKKYTHELEFWGGDLESLRGKLDYIKGLGADVVYTTPIFQAQTNHKYDTEDYRRIDPGFGTLADFRALVRDVHQKRMKLVLDGVFNHMGATAPAFLAALKNAKDKHRSWFKFGAGYIGGYQGWAGVPSLPQLDTSSPALATELWSGKDSVVRHWLHEGADGWRLDVAFHMGPKVVGQIRQAAHETKPGSLVVGEIPGYPSDWFGAIDGVFNFYSVQVGNEMLRGHLTGGRAGKLLERAVEDAGIENILRSWAHFDNHDTSRAASLVPDQKLRNLAFALQFTLPGSPVVYYGSELGMTGEGDPGSRAPMRWDMDEPSNPTKAWIGHLSRLRKKLPALRYGDFRMLDSDRLLAFLRVTDKALETVMVVVNPTDEKVTETLPFRQGKVMSWGELRDVEGGGTVRAIEGLVRLTMKPRSVAVYVPVDRKVNGYSPYDRID